MARVLNGCQRTCWSAWSFGVCWVRLAKRSKALWGHNLARDSRVEGASMTSWERLRYYSSDARFILPQLVRLDQ